MNTNLKQNVRLAFAAIALLFVCTVASVKADLGKGSSNVNVGQTAHFNGGPMPVCVPGQPCFK